MSAEGSVTVSGTRSNLALCVRIAGPPQPQQRHRSARRKGKGGNVYVASFEPPASASWKGVAKVVMQTAVRVATGSEAPPWPADAPLEVHVLAVFPLGAAGHLKRGVRARGWHLKHQGDADNIAKAALDAGNGVLWLDDRQVVRLVVEKVVAAQDEAPRVEVRVAQTRLAPERAGLEPFAGVAEWIAAREASRA